MRIKILLLISCVGSLSFGLKAQDVVASSGHEFFGDAGAFTGTVGEVVVGEISGDAYMVTQGFQQADIDFLDAIKILKSIKVAVYPNPVSDQLNLMLDDNEAGVTNYLLTDLSGKPIFNGRLSVKTSSLNVSTLPAGTYVLQLSRNNQSPCLEKIIKQ